MNFKNTENNYGAVAKIFHWAMAAIILGLIMVGLYMTGMENSPRKFEIYALHKSFGILILWLVGLRILWRAFTRPPAPHENHALWEHILAKGAHIFLYAAMIGMPLSGWLMSSAGEYPVPFFGINMPDLVGKNIDLAKAMKEVHEILAFALIGAVGLHAMGALKHHFIDRDSTLLRMLAKPFHALGPYIIVFVLVLFGFVVLRLVVPDILKPKTQGEEVRMQINENDVTTPSSFEKTQWQIIPELSQINFTSRVYNTPFTGVFPNIEGKIIFDPNDLENAQADITIYIKDMNSGDGERDAEMLGQEWFNISEYTTAHFKTMTIEQGEASQEAATNYIAIGELIIKNRAMPVTLPFTLDFAENNTKAYMSGQLSLNRLDFGLGLGRWEDTDIVDLNVDVDVKMVAHASE